MLFAMAIYKKMGDRFVIEKKVDPSKGLFSGHQLDRFINITLPMNLKHFRPDSFNYVEQGSEHHYIKFVGENKFYVLIAKAPLDVKKLAYLFSNVAYVDNHPKDEITLEILFQNTHLFSEKFIDLEKTKKDIEETHQILIEKVVVAALKRGEALELLLPRTEELKGVSFKFNEKSAALKASYLPKCC